MCMATDYTLASSGVMEVCSCGFLASPLHFPAPLPQSAPVDRQPNEASKNKVPIKSPFKVALFIAPQNES